MSLTHKIKYPPPLHYRYRWEGRGSLIRLRNTLLNIISLCLFKCVCVCVCVCFNTFVSSFVCVDFIVQISLDTCVCVCVCVERERQSVCVCVQGGRERERVCVCRESVCVFKQILFSLYVCMSVCQSVCVCLSVCLTVCVCVSVCLSSYQRKFSH